MKLRDRIIITNMFFSLKFDDLINAAHGPLQNMLVFGVGVSLALIIAFLWNGYAKDSK